jgi:hypothetical protein
VEVKTLKFKASGLYENKRTVVFAHGKKHWIESWKLLDGEVK